MPRKNKSFPLECSSKQPVSVLRQVIDPIRPKAIDPRFDRAFGSFHEDAFKESYAFVKDIQKNERRTLEESLKSEKNPRKADAIRRALDRQNSIARAKEQSDFKHRVLQKWKKTERELIGEGKKPFHLKKSDEKQLMLVAKFKEMQEQRTKNNKGNQAINIDKLVEKRRKHKAAKQHTKLPFSTDKNDEHRQRNMNISWHLVRGWAPKIMELKARLTALENQINSLQNALNVNENNSGNINRNVNGNLKSILLKLKLEHQAVLQNIEKALEIVDNNQNQNSTPVKIISNDYQGSSPSPRLRDKINTLLTTNTNTNNKLHYGTSTTSSPLSNTANHMHNMNHMNHINNIKISNSPATEKSHITFDILNELDGGGREGRRRVHFSSENEDEMSVASREYLRKYGLL